MGIVAGSHSMSVFIHHMNVPGNWSYALDESSPATVDIICGIVRYLKPTIIVEAGTFHGVTALAVAGILKRWHPAGCIYTAELNRIDLSDQIMEMGVEDNIEVFSETSFENMMLLVPEPVDMAFVDNHKPDGERLDYIKLLIDEYMVQGGVIVVDDCLSTRPGPYKRITEYVEDMNLPHIMLDNDRGMYLIQKPFI